MTMFALIYNGNKCIWEQPFDDHEVSSNLIAFTIFFPASGLAIQRKLTAGKRSLMSASIINNMIKINSVQGKCGVELKKHDSTR